MGIADREFYVLCRERCPRCGGSGLRAAGRKRRALAAIAPDEPIPCPTCEGEGRLEYPIPLLQALAEVMGENDHVRRPARHRGAF